jgi:phosphoribosylanthranilate isomerase
VERTPGIKDPEMIRAFIRAARALPSPLPVYGERSDRFCDPGDEAEIARRHGNKG